MRSKVSSDWLPSYIKATQPVLEILKMAGYFPDRPRILVHLKGQHYLKYYHINIYYNTEHLQ